MSNLGWYQLMTTVAKKVGGPKRLLLIIVSGSSAVTLGIQRVIKLICKKGKEENNKDNGGNTETEKYTAGYTFKAGDTIRVVENDGDAGLVVINGDEDNPVFVSLEALKKQMCLSEEGGENV